MLASVGLLACLAASGAAIGLRTGLLPRTFLTSAPPQATPTPLPLSKEYIYAGGRLIATEEPAPQGPPPSNLVATAESAPTVSLTWTAPTSGVVTGYVVERRHSPSGTPDEISTGSNTPGFNDTSALVDKAYLYRVRAVFTGGGTSGYSNKDLATTVIFTNSSLQGLVIKADHLKEARIYRAGAKIGSGSTADAIRFERATGQLLSPAGHSIKGRESIRALEGLIRSGKLNPAETNMAKFLVNDLKQALATPTNPLSIK